MTWVGTVSSQRSLTAEEEGRQSVSGGRDGRKTRPVTAGFEDRGRGHEPRNTGGSRSCQGKGSPLRGSRKIQSCQHLDVSPEKLISDF